MKPVPASEAIQSNFGTRLRADGSWETYGQSAYMLVYVAEDAAEDVCFAGGLPGEEGGDPTWVRRQEGGEQDNRSAGSAASLA